MKAWFNVLLDEEVAHFLNFLVSAERAIIQSGFYTSCVHKESLNCASGCCAVGFLLKSTVILAFSAAWLVFDDVFQNF